MIVVNGLRGDMVLSACLRYDLAPIPLTFEAQIRLAPDVASDFQDGGVIRVNEIDFRIIKCEPMKNGGGLTQGAYPLSAVSITAFPEAVVNVARRRRTAVIAENTSFAALYRSCGATANVSGDINIGRFACFKGDVPTFQLAQVMQEEGAVLMWKAGKVVLMRLRDLMAQKPSESLTVLASEDVRSDFLVNDEIPTYFSTGPDGKFLFGDQRAEAQAVVYTPHKNARELALMGRVLVRRKVITCIPSLGVRAGDVFDVAGTPLVVMTAAHCMQNNVDGGGAKQYSRLWLGGLS
jgi:hypothetical protein